MGMRDSAAARCRAPKTAKGAAKHKLLKATILSRPRARAISVFAVHSATRIIRMPALHIETTVREIPQNRARMVVCILDEMPSVGPLAVCGARFPGRLRIAMPRYARTVGGLPRAWRLITGMVTDCKTYPLKSCRTRRPDCSPRESG